MALRLRRAIALARTFSTTSSASVHSSSSGLLAKASSSPIIPMGYGHLCGFNRPSLPSRCMIARCRVSNSGSVYSPLDSNDSGRREPLFPGCDYEHWLVTMEFPEPQPSREEKIDTFVKTLANIVGGIDEAKKRIYALSTSTYTGFMCEISEELSEKIKKEPGVVWVLPDSYADPLKKEYGVGDKYINGVIIPDTRVYNRPTGRDRPRNRRRDSMPLERRDVQIPRDPLPPIGGRDTTVQGNAAVQGVQRDYRPPMDGRGPQDYRPPVDARGPQDYRPPMDARGPEDYRPPMDARGPQDYRPPMDARGPQDYRPPMDARGPQDYRPPMDARGPQDYRPPMDARGPQDYRPPMDTRGPQDYRPPMAARGPMPGDRQDYRPPVDARGPMPGDRQDYRPPMEGRGPMAGDRQDYRPPMEGRGPIPGGQQDYVPPMEGRGSVATQGRDPVSRGQSEPFPWPMEGAN